MHTEAERNHIRTLFEGWKEEHAPGSLDPMSQTALVDVPAFREALRRLIEEQGYLKTDVARWLGVSRERVRQWTERAGIVSERHPPLGRGFDPELGRFVPMSSTERKALRRGHERQRRRRRRADRWDRLAARLNVLERRLGRVPCLQDLADDLGAKKPSAVAGKLYAPDATHAERVDELWRLAGYDERPRYAGFGAARPETLEEAS